MTFRDQGTYFTNQSGLASKKGISIKKDDFTNIQKAGLNDGEGRSSSLTPDTQNKNTPNIRRY